MSWAAPSKWVRWRDKYTHILITAVSRDEDRTFCHTISLVFWHFYKKWVRELAWRTCEKRKRRFHLFNELHTTLLLTPIIRRIFLQFIKKWHIRSQAIVCSLLKKQSLYMLIDYYYELLRKTTPCQWCFVLLYMNVINIFLFCYHPLKNCFICFTISDT